MSIERKEFGFKWEAAEVVCLCEHKGHVMIQVRTPKEILDIRVTPKGSIRINEVEKVKK